MRISILWIDILTKTIRVKGFDTSVSNSRVLLQHNQIKSLRNELIRLWSLMPIWEMPEQIILFGLLVNIRSIGVEENSVTRVGSLVSC